MDLPSSPPPPTADGGTDPDSGPVEARGVGGDSPSEGAPAESRSSPWGLVGSTLVAAAVLSGLPLVSTYRPVPSWVAADLSDLRELGWLGYVQQLHGALAEASVLALWLLVIGLAVRGVYHSGARSVSTTTRGRLPGRRTWALALTGLALVMAWATSGRLLRWDTLARETLGDWLGAGGDEAAALLGIWALHCVLLPALGLLAWLLVRKRSGDGLGRGD